MPCKISNLKFYFVIARAYAVKHENSISSHINDFTK